MCGIFGITKTTNIIEKANLIINTLKHRGEESVGLVGYYNNIPEQIKSVTNTEYDFILGHTRYSTTNNKKLTQPIVINNTSIAHNGNLYEFDSNNEIDSEYITRIIASSSSLTEAISTLENTTKGSMNLIGSYNNTLFAYKGANNNRPLEVGKLNNAIVISSETCSFDRINATFSHSVAPGYIELYKENNITKIALSTIKKYKKCIFELLYFLRPDSALSFDNKPNVSIYEYRYKLGQLAAKTLVIPENIDFISPIPDSGIPYAVGFASQSKIPYQFSISRNHYIGRTFIQPTNEQRKKQLMDKIVVNPYLVKDKNILLLDDSIVRGNTLVELIKKLKEYNTKSIHVISCAPKIIGACYYGIDIPDEKELIANNTVFLSKHFDIDSIQFLQIKDILKFVNTPKEWCTTCFTKEYW